MRWLAVLALAVLAPACVSGVSSTQPSATPGVSATAPFSISIGTTTGAGQATITAFVQNDGGGPVAGVAVTFATDVGTLSAANVTTGSNGKAAATLTASAAARVTVSTGTLSASTLIAAPPAPPAPVVLAVSFPAVSGVANTATLLLANVSNGGATVTFQWTFGDGAAPDSSTTASISHTYTAAGSYQASVQVTDALGRTATASGTITITSPPAPPPPPAPSYTVTLAVSPTPVLVGASPTLTATVTRNNGAVAATSFAWDCSGTGALIVTTAITTQSCTYPVAGTITSKVTVTGGAGATAASGSGSVSVTVSTAIPVVTVNCSTGVHLASASTCVVSATLGTPPVVVPSANITSVSWDFGDGTTVTTPSNLSPSHTYASTNTFTVVASNVIVTGATGPGTGSTTTTIVP